MDLTIISGGMAVLAKGTVSDRPWGQTLGALAKRGLSGQLTITADGKPYRIAFGQGAVVGASSPLASDAAVRLALTGGLVSSTQVNDITRRVAASPHRDEIEVIAEAARLAPEHAQRLRRRLVAQRAARTFSLDRGDFVIEDQISVPVIPGSELDVRAVINLGARGNLSEARLVDELSQFGVWFKLAAEAIGDLPQYGFTEVDKPVLQDLIAGANLADMTGDHPEVGERGVRAIVYALVSYGACEVSHTEVPTNRPRKPTAAPAPIGQILPPRPSSVTNTPTFRKAHPVAEDAATVIPRGRTSTPTVNVVPPEGMSIRSPGSTQVPRTQTPTSHPAFDQPTSRTPPMGSPVVGRVPTADPRSSGRSPTASNPVVPRSATGNPRTATGPVRSPTGGNPVIPRSPTSPVISRTATGNNPAMTRAVTGRTPTPQDIAYGRTPTPDQPPERAQSPTSPVMARTQTPMRAPSPGEPVISRTISQSRATPPPRTSAGPARSRPNTTATIDTENLIRERLGLVERGADHFNLLGISQDATPDIIRAAYFTLARKLHPDRLASLGIHEREAHRLMANINAAFAILNDTVKRAEYTSILSRGGESAVRAEEAKADELAMRVMHAEEAFRRGEMALRREQLDTAMKEFTTATELQPQEPEYQALFTWTKFAAATDKQAIAQKTRTELQRAAEKSEQSPTARFYLGRVERILGREREALDHFHEVLRIKPNHSEASSEIRVLESRLKKR